MKSWPRRIPPSIRSRRSNHRLAAARRTAPFFEPPLNILNRSKDKRKILIQLDSDAQASVFDRVVAIDAGADEVFSYADVKPEQVRDLVHGAIFTRGPKELKSTALFIGGSNVAAGERLFH